MNRIFLISCVLLALLTAANAGEIYTYTDKDGNTVISNNPIPEKYQGKSKKIESYERSSPEEIERFETERKAKEQKQENKNRKIDNY